MNDEKDIGGTSIRVTPRLLLGAGILIVGVLFTLDNLGVLDASYAFDFWPLIFIAIGAMKIKDAPRTGAWLSGALWIFFGALWILYNIGAVDVHPIELWPILLIIAGYMLITRAVKPAKAREDAIGEGHKMSAVAALCGVKRQTASKDFRGGDFTAVMGGCEVDLRNAEIQGEAIIDVFAFWGGIDIRVPPTFMVDSQVTPLLGGFDDKTDLSNADPNQKLVIRGIAMMGGVDVRN